MMPGSKVNKHIVLAHKCLYDLVTRPNMRIKVGRKPHDIRILGRIVGVQSTEQSVGIFSTHIIKYSYRLPTVAVFLCMRKFKVHMWIIIRNGLRRRELVCLHICKSYVSRFSFCWHLCELEILRQRKIPHCNNYIRRLLLFGI